MVVVTRKEGKNKKETAAAADAESKPLSETLHPSIKEDKEEKEEADAIADPSPEAEPVDAQEK